MEIKNIILRRLEEKGEIKISDIVDETSFSRIFIHRFFDELQKEGKRAKRPALSMTEGF